MTNTASSSGAAALQAFSVPNRPKMGGAVRLSANDIAALSKAREARWRPGLADQPFHSEIFASAEDAGGAGLALALARDALAVAGRQDNPLAQPQDVRQILWVQEKRTIERAGRLYAPGLPDEWRERLIHVEAATPEDALFALEEGLKCRDLACVIGEITGNPRALDFTASRRLSLTAEKHKVALWLVRVEAQADLSSARMRWKVEPAASAPQHWNGEAPGEAAWKAELFRARGHAPGNWIVSREDGKLCARRPRKARYPNVTSATIPDAIATNRAAHSRHMVRPTFGRSLAAVARA